MSPPRPRILLIDSYDSFTYNLASLCKRAIPHSIIHIIKNDALPATSLIPLLNRFDAVIIGPGPGSPDIPKDIGAVADIWHVPDHLLVPVFGVCLGLQSLAVEYGAKIKRLNVVKHGLIYRVDHMGTDIFQNVDEIQAVRYHSLHIELSGEPHLIPLAWADDGLDDGNVLMGLKHATKPFWAVQYHPESVCTHGGGEDVIRNFWRLAVEWSSTHGRSTVPWDVEVEASIGPQWPSIRPDAFAHDDVASVPVATQMLRMPRLDIPRVCEMLGVEDDTKDFVMLDSAAAPGRFSIIGCLTPTSPKIAYSVNDAFIRVQQGSHVAHDPLGTMDIWAWLTAYTRARKAHGGSPEVPFWGGLVGYLSYELGSQTISSLPSRGDTDVRHDDVNLVFVERSIVVDTHSDAVYLQTIIPGDEGWLLDMTQKLDTLSCSIPDGPSFSAKATKVKGALPTPVITLPNCESYIAKIVTAQEWLFSGDSYELCVTAPTRVVAPKAASAVARGTSSSWALYKILRTRNPAPHSGFIRLSPSTLLSSSPERFLSYARPPDGLCQLRPIKGTVRKAPGITRAVAEEMLAGSKKEVAENLMIVDLIRHDLHSIVGEDVHVKQFCRVEEYETVWQLVSVIEGRPAPSIKDKTHSDLGWEVLRASLPPGSMTGAPKKRSVEILRHLEGAERGIYSGVVGYADVGGGGDWAVIIRSCFKHDAQTAAHPADASPREQRNEQDSPDSTHPGDVAIETSRNHTRDSALQTQALTDEWTLGAGGAITALSDPVAEWEEMITKVESVLRAFGDLESH